MRREQEIARSVRRSGRESPGGPTAITDDAVGHVMPPRREVANFRQKEINPALNVLTRVSYKEFRYSRLKDDEASTKCVTFAIFQKGPPVAVLSDC